MNTIVFLHGRQARKQLWRRVWIIVAGAFTAVLIYLAYDFTQRFPFLFDDARPTALMEDAFASSAGPLMSQGEIIQFDDPELAYGMCYGGRYWKLGPSLYECRGP